MVEKRKMKLRFVFMAFNKLPDHFVFQGKQIAKCTICKAQ